jgi:hypothetical protein
MPGERRLAMRGSKSLLVLSGMVCACLVLTSRSADAAGLSADAALDRLKSLTGAWEGTGGDDGGEFPTRVTYRVTGGGSAVLETLFADTPHEMISVYHKDGDRLVMTHYCAMGNQPRMRLAEGSTPQELRFDFDGGSNFDPARDPHIHSGWIKILSTDRIEAEWSAFSAGKDAGPKRLKLTRAAAQ